MTYLKALEYLKTGKCKGITRLDLPYRYFLSLFKYTLSWHSISNGKPNAWNYRYNPEDIIMYANDALDTPNRWITDEMMNDDKWLIGERLWDECDIESR